MIVAEALAKSKNTIDQISSSSVLDAEVILSYVLKQNRSWLIANPEFKLTILQLIKLYWFINRRRKLMPIAYLTHNREFFGRNFFINKFVLVPRPESETIIEVVLETLSKETIDKIIEVGTGSGCLAVTLALETNNIPIVATDISFKALGVAKKNARLHKVSNKINFIKGNLLKPVLLDISSSTMIIANLPYLKTAELTTALKREPKLALDGGTDGMKYYNELLNQVANLNIKAKPKYLILELHEPTAIFVQKLITKYFPHASLYVINDLAGKPRVLKALLI